METNRGTNRKIGTKKELRTQVLSQRRVIAQEEWKRKSLRICERVTCQPAFLEAKEIYCYVDYRKEVGTRLLLEQAWEMGKSVAVPKIVDGEMRFFYIENLSQLEEGFCHILEPTTDREATGAHVLVVMPGAVFDKKCNRIGYGGGFYDRYLKKYPDYQTLALAFELQIVENIPAEPHDQRPQMIITEENIYV